MHLAGESVSYGHISSFRHMCWQTWRVESNKVVPFELNHQLNCHIKKKTKKCSFLLQVIFDIICNLKWKFKKIISNIILEILLA